MKFFHTADIHLGATPEKENPKLANRGKEIFDTFSRIIDQCEQEKPELLLIAGDLFHRQPLVRELKEVNYLFSKLTDTRVVLIAGNHDYIGARSNYIDFKWNENVIVMQSEYPESVYIEDLNVEIYGFSYHNRDVADERLKTVAPENKNRINILLAHGGEGRSLPFDRKKLMNAGFDYVALGHLHKPELISERMAYPGSPEPLDKNELGEHGFIKGEIIAEADSEKLKNSIKTEWTPIACRKYIRHEFVVTPDMTNTSVTEMLRQFIEREGKENIYHLIFSGKRDKDITLDIQAYEQLGIMTRLTDETVPDYNFDELMAANSDNLIGMYIKRIREKSENDETAYKALYYGLEALLASSGR